MAGTDLRLPGSCSESRRFEDVIRFLRENQITLTYDPAEGTLHAGTAGAATTVTLKAS